MPEVAACWVCGDGLQASDPDPLTAYDLGVCKPCNTCSPFMGEMLGEESEGGY